MTVEHVELLNFRNFINVNLPFESNLIILYGSNAQGKTNLLEALYFASWSGSFRRILHDDPINWEHNSAKEEVTLKNGSSRQKITVLFKKGERWQYFLNNTSLGRRETSQYLASFYFSPHVEKYIYGEPNYRRKIFNLIISQKNRNYLYLIANYSKVLKNRNFLLKKGKLGDLKVWDEHLIKLGSEITLWRVLMIKDLNKLLGKVYLEISPNNESSNVRVNYRCGVLSAENVARISADDLPVITDYFRELLLKSGDQEKRFRQTLVGPHRDDFIFVKDGRDLRFYSSRGEGLKIIAALKIAQFDFLGKTIASPVFLVDDLLQDLDREKSRLFMKAVGRRGQVVIATAHEESLPAEVWQAGQKLAVKSGEVRPWSKV